MLPARIGDLASFIGRWRKPIHGRIPEMPLRRRFWERVIDGPIGALVLAGRGDEAEAALKRYRRSVRLRRRAGVRPGRGQRDAGRRRPGRSGSADGQGAARAAGCRRRVLRRTGLARNSRSRAPRCRARSGRPPRRQARHRPGRDQQAADRGGADRASARCASRAAIPSCSAAAARKSRRCARPASPIRWCRALPPALGAAAQFEVPLTFRTRRCASPSSPRTRPETPRPSTGRR